ARDELRGDQPLPGRGPAEGPRPEDAPRAPPWPPAHDDHAPHEVRPAEDRGAPPPPRGVPYCDRPHRRGDPDHPSVEGRGGRGNEPDGQIPALDGAGEGDPRHAP